MIWNLTKYSTIALVLFTFFILVVTGFEYKLRTFNLCETIRDSFENSEILITITDQDDDKYYCTLKFCISPDFGFTEGFDYTDDMRYDECIGDIYEYTKTKSEQMSIGN